MSSLPSRGGTAASAAIAAALDALYVLDADRRIDAAQLAVIEQKEAGLFVMVRDPPAYSDGASQLGNASQANLAAALQQHAELAQRLNEGDSQFEILSSPTNQRHLAQDGLWDTQNLREIFSISPQKSTASAAVVGLNDAEGAVIDAVDDARTIVDAPATIHAAAPHHSDPPSEDTDGDAPGEFFDASEESAPYDVDADSPAMSSSYLGGPATQMPLKEFTQALFSPKTSAPSPQPDSPLKGSERSFSDLGTPQPETQFMPPATQQVVPATVLKTVLPPATNPPTKTPHAVPHMVPFADDDDSDAAMDEDDEPAVLGPREPDQPAIDRFLRPLSIKPGLLLLSQLSSSSPSSSSAASATSKGAVQPPTSPQSSPAKSPTKGTSSQTTIAQRIQAITKPPLVARQTSSSTSQLLLQSPSSSASVRSYQTSQPPQESLVSLSGSSSGSNASEACNKSVPFLSPDLSPSPVQHETSQGLKQKTMAALFPEFVRRPIAQAPQVPGLFVNQSPVRSRQQHQLAHSDPISNKRPSEWSENDAHVTKKPTPAASATSPIKPIARPSPQSHRPLAAGALSSPRPAFAISSPSPLPLTPAGNIDLKQAWAMRGRSNSVSVSAPGAHANAPAILRPSALSQSAPTSPASPFTNLPRKEFTTKVNIDKFVSAAEEKVKHMADSMDPEERSRFLENRRILHLPLRLPKEAILHPMRWSFLN